MLKLICLLLAFQIAAAAFAQERKLSLSGVFSLGYTNTRAAARADAADRKIENRARELSAGLDLNLGTYIVDPRFIKLSFETSFLRNKGAFDEFPTRYGINGANFYLDFLPTSPYPLRFRFLEQRSSFLEKQISSARTSRRSLGFDWELRKPRYPRLFVNYDTTSYDYGFSAASLFKSHARAFFLGLTDTYKGWGINSSYTNQSATEGITNSATGLNLLRFDARKQVSRKSDLFISSFYERLRFSSGIARLSQDFSFFNARTDFSTKHSDKLNSRIFNQFYLSTSSAGSPRPRGRPGLILQGVGLGSTNDGAISTPINTTNFFNTIGGQVAYRLMPEVTLGGTMDASLISAPDKAIESATRFVDIAATINWNRRIKFVNTRASYLQGLAYARSNLGNDRSIKFRNYAAGLSIGDAKYALISADYNFSLRPSVFEIGGLFSQRYLNGGVESQALKIFRLHGSIGRNELDYLTTRGRERFRLKIYSASLDHRLFTLMLARNFNIGLRDVFSIPVPLVPNRVFRILPTHALINDPLLNTSGSYALGLLRIKPRRNLDVELRYLKDKAFFVIANNVFARQFDLLITYKLGKFALTGGALFNRQMIEGLLSRDRVHYFFRLSRSFRIS